MADKSDDQLWVEKNEPRAFFRHYTIEGREYYCIDLPYGSSTAMFFSPEQAWTAARRMVEDECV